ncbi:protein of unknown function [Kingella kingae]|nr:protein of unknown function [Kingella kingae]
MCRADTRACAGAALHTARYPPLSNRGGVKKQRDRSGAMSNATESMLDQSAFQNPEYFSHYITNEKGDLIEIPLRRGQSNGAFIENLYSQK